MFNLDTAIATWRHSLSQNRVFLEDDLDELESHVRDEVENYVRDGMTVEASFRRTMQDMGNPIHAESEYRKVYWGKLRLHNKLKKELVWRASMFKNYLKTAVRNLLRHRGIATINLVGLAVGLAACVMIGLYVQDELSFDRFNQKSERIYRMGQGTTGWPYGRIAEETYPEVEDVVYMRSYPTMSILKDGTHYFEDMLYADGGFFDMFDFPMVEGDGHTALDAPYTVVISEGLASTLFGDADALGQTLVMQDSLRFEVTGVTQVPRQSHIQFDMLVSFETLRAVNGNDWYDGQMSDGWLNLNVVNYVLLKENADPDAFEQKIAGMPMEYAGDMLERWGATGFKLALEPLDTIYLRSDMGNALGPQSDINYVYLLAGVGLFLLLIAAANFINLMTARATQRAREVGVRKAVGSSRQSLIQQFLTESGLTALTSMVLAFGLVAYSLPYFNDLAARDYAFSDILTFKMVAILVGLVLFVGLLAGIYPAFKLSSFRPVEVLRGRSSEGPGGSALRKSLVVFQFAISGALIIGTIIVLQQLRFMKGQDLGFDADQVLVLDARQAPGRELSRSTETLIQALEKHPGVQTVSSTWAVPGRNGWIGQLSFPEGWAEDKSISLEYIPVDESFVETIGLNIVAGRDFDPTRTSDAQDAVIINEAAVREVGWESPEEAIGKGFTSPGSGKPNGVVIGVVEDYHQHGLQDNIPPIMFGVRRSSGLFAMRVDASQTPDIQAHIRETWDAMFQGFPYGTFFVDEDFQAAYADEQRLMGIFATFAGLTVLIGCLGLFGLAAFMASRRTKEIGVRKVMGATSGQIVRLLSKDFLILVLIAVVIASPLAWFGMNKWLDDFAYRIDIGFSVFVLTAVIALGIALATVSWQAFKAAGSNPVKSLRYD